MSPRVPEPAPSMVLLLCFVLAALMVAVARGCEVGVSVTSSHLEP